MALYRECCFRNYTNCGERGHYCRFKEMIIRIARPGPASLYITAEIFAKTYKVWHEWKAWTWVCKEIYVRTYTFVSCLVMGNKSPVYFWEHFAEYTGLADSWYLGKAGIGEFLPYCDTFFTVPLSNGKLDSQLQKVKTTAPTSHSTG